MNKRNNIKKQLENEEAKIPQPFKRKEDMLGPESRELFDTGLIRGIGISENGKVQVFVETLEASKKVPEFLDGCRTEILITGKIWAD